MKLLSSIDNPQDLRKLQRSDLDELARELREFIISIVAEHGGHLGASLGTVELTVALHYIYQTPNDLLVWDVGHQAYGHKILTERREQFHTNRKLHGLSGFPKRAESEYDTFGVGHSSTSISAALGMALADKLQKKQRQHVAVIGDAAMQAGMAFEALNHAGTAGTNLTVVLNDNCMSIDPSVGALNQFLKSSVDRYRSEPNRIYDQLERAFAGKPQPDSNLFEDLHFSYFGPIDGHDIELLNHVFEKTQQLEGPKLIHVITKKGKGYEPAETGNPTKWHAPGIFDAATGKVLKKEKPGEKAPKFQDVFGQSLVELAHQNEKLVGITPAMPTGSSLTFMMDEFPQRTFDVGIAEQHAVTLAAGMATQGLLPVVAIYSTFLQRAYDQLIHDVAIQNLKVIFCIDRAGLVGADGPTHHGAYDIAYSRCIPNLIIAAPRNEHELRNLLYTAQLDEVKQSFLIRYPRGRGSLIDWKNDFEKVEIGKGEILKDGERVAVLSIGTTSRLVEKALTETKHNPTHADMRFVKPLDTALIDDLAKDHKVFITVEDGAKKGGFGSAVAEYVAEHHPGIRVKILGIPDEVIEHGTQEELYSVIGSNPATIRTQIDNAFTP
ncbi:1-deoxy-D-xylulose-5-phosphate synthase [Salibacter halophilus]|uniref:1-deoxy-D-xylulose-5-phosphate synthase n=1 Tax=Salibacter halophilus TaxID=1803916 RepID=A0A6N6M4V4_9FLAO|nr:1-deoxy-D-xylulose-5-phosphate synthase [Salibacter halophilus]KAB1063166.1 1-deoxy-D-xylulose-5-phosphate synthase [Salibacter halophilus]